MPELVQPAALTVLCLKHKERLRDVTTFNEDDQMVTRVMMGGNLHKTICIFSKSNLLCFFQADFSG